VDLLTISDVLDAADRLGGVAHRTPVLTSRAFDGASGHRVFFKCEHLQRGGAFKFRGAYNRISRIPAAERRRGVVAFSSGNHAQAVALTAGLFGIPAVICMPSDAPGVKVEATRGYGAEVVFYDRLKDDRVQFGQRVAAERGLTLVPPYDHPDVIAGQGTAALELLEEVPDLDALLVPVGGGGLISGCAVAAKAMRPHIRVIGIEPETANDTLLSLQAGHRVETAPSDTIADGIRGTTPGELTFPHMQVLVDDIVLVSDAEILAAMRFLGLRLKQVVEPTGAVGAAALLHGKIPARLHRVGVIVSGGNAEPGMIARAMAAE
jgi:threonine dehydratase